MHSKLQLLSLTSQYSLKTDYQHIYDDGTKLYEPWFTTIERENPGYRDNCIYINYLLPPSSHFAVH
jgi:hypothetical protein